MTRVTESRLAADAPPRVVDVPGLRVDAPHAHGLPQPAETAPPAVGAVELPPADLSFDAAAQLQNQAGQLAAHLVARQRELDHREASLHAQLAQWEHDFARNRLTLDERERELLEREQGLTQRAAELAAREHAASRREADARRAQVEAELFLRRQEDELELRETHVKLVEERVTNEQRLVRHTSDELRQSRERFHRLTRRLRQRLERRRVEFEDHSQRALEALERRRAAIEAVGLQLDAAEPAPADEIEQLRVVLRMELLAVRRMLDEREQAVDDLERRRAECAAEQEAESAQLADRERALASLAQELDARRAALDRSTQDIAAQLQLVLGERLAVEELWSRLATRDEFDAQRPRPAEIEARLAATFAAERERLDARAEELDRLRAALVEEHARQARQQTALETWTAARERDLGEKTRALTRRAQELEGRLAKLHRDEVELRLTKLKRAN